MSIYLWIFLGSGCGGVLRYIIAAAMNSRFGEAFPWGTFLINVTGSFIIGFFATVAGAEGRLPVNDTIRQFVTVGILGGYTTYSAFSLQTLALARNGEWPRAAAYALGTFLLCFVGVWLGHRLAAHWNHLGA